MLTFPKPNLSVSHTFAIAPMRNPWTFISQVYNAEHDPTTRTTVLSTKIRETTAKPIYTFTSHSIRRRARVPQLT